MYIVSDFVQGVTLADRLTAGLFTPREAVELAAQIADALHHAHESGVIHRDLKPSNIMLDGDGVPHLMDFGLAKREAGEITMTVEGKLLGTPAYMSPEQARGEGHHVDRRTDVYSLGVILFELLTGERPFRGNQRMLLHQVINDDPPSPRKLNSRVPRDLETICLKCLEKEPRRRYFTSAEVASELRRHLSGEEIEARPITKIERAWRWVQRNPLVASLTSGVLALFLTVALVSLWAYARANSDAKEMARLARTEQEARKDAERQLRIATGERLAALSLISLRDNPKTAALLAVASVEATTLHNEPARSSAMQALYEALAEVRGRKLEGHLRAIRCLALSRNGRWLVTAGDDKTARVWDLQAADPAAGAKVLRGHLHRISCLAISPDGHWLVTGSDDTMVRVWDMQAANPAAGAKVLRGHAGPITCLTVSTDGRWLVTGSEDKTARIWDLRAANPAAEAKVHRGHELPVLCLALSANRRWLVTGSGDGTARLWDLQAVNPAAGARVILKHENWISFVTLSNEGRWLVTGSGATARLWDLQVEGPAVEVNILGGGSISCLAATGDVHMPVTGSNDGKVRVWDLRAGDPMWPRVLSGHEGAIECLAISPDGRWLATGSEDNTARVWDLQAADSAAEAKVLRGHKDRITCLALSPDGRWLVTGSEDAAARVWLLDPTDLCRLARARAGRELTDEEQERYAVPAAPRTVNSRLKRSFLPPFLTRLPSNWSEQSH